MMEGKEIVILEKDEKGTVVFDKITPVIQSAKSILLQNKTSYEKAIEYAESLIKQAKEKGMTDVLYNEMKTTVKKIKDTKTSMNERRKPFTQIVGLLAKEFTSLESDLLSNEFVKSLSDEMNKYATLLYKQAEKRKEDARIKSETEKEKVKIISDYEMCIRTAYNTYVSKQKTVIYNLYDNCTNEAQLDLAKKEINKLCLNKNCEFIFSNKYEYHKPEEVNVITSKFNIENLNNILYLEGQKEIDVYKIEVIDKFESKRTQIKDRIALEIRLKNEKDEADRIAAEAQKKRKQEEEARIKLEEENKIKEQQKELLDKAKAEIKVNDIAENSRIETKAQASVSMVKSVIKTKISYEIKFNSSLGWLQIVQFWFDNFGYSIDESKVGGYSLDRMKSFCEKFANDNQTFIKSDYIQYVQKVEGK